MFKVSSIQCSVLVCRQLFDRYGGSAQEFIAQFLGFRSSRNDLWWLQVTTFVQLFMLLTVKGKQGPGSQELWVNWILRRMPWLTLLSWPCCLLGWLCNTTVFRKNHFHMSTGVRFYFLNISSSVCGTFTAAELGGVGTYLFSIDCQRTHILRLCGSELIYFVDVKLQL